MLADLQLLRIPPLVPGEGLRLDGERTFPVCRPPVLPRRKRTNVNVSTSQQSESLSFKQLQLPFATGKQQHAVRLSGRGLEALKHGLQHLDLWGLRFTDEGLGLEGLAGSAFLHQSLFHAYSNTCPASFLEAFLETRFDLLLGVSSTGSELALDVDWDSRQLVCGESVLCRLPVQLSSREPTEVRVGPLLGRVLTRSLLEFLRMCGPFSIKNIWLRFSRGNVQAVARHDVCVVEHTLESEPAFETETQSYEQPEMEIELPLFPVFDKARAIEFFGQPGDFQLRYCFGVDSFLMHVFR
jgi:hypothetical protein